MTLNEFVEIVDSEDRIEIMLIGEKRSLYEGVAKGFRVEEQYSVKYVTVFDDTLLVGVRRI